MKFWTTLLIYIVAPVAFAEAPDLARALTRARNAAEIRKIVAQFEDLRIARSACQIQLRTGNAPVACYETLELEIRHGMHTLASERRRLRLKLDEICEKSARELRVARSETKNPVPLSASCRQNLANARAIQNYRARNPEIGPDLDE